VAPVRADPAPAAPAPPTPEDAFRGGAPHLYLGARNLLRTSHFDWTTGLSLELLGGERGLHTMDFALVPRLSFLQTDDHWAFVGTRVSVAVVLAEDKRSDVDSPAFGDLPIDLGYAYTFLQRGDGLVVRAGPRGTVAFPTSPASNAIGVYLTTRLGLQIDGNIPLLPGEALNGVFVTGSAGWQHRFTEAQTPVGEDVVRQNASGKQFTSDVISAPYLERDRFTLSLAWWLNLWGDLSLGNGWGIGFPVKYAAEEPVCITITNAPCAEVRPDEQVASLAYSTSFDVSLSYLAARLVWIAAGYANSAPSLDSAGKRRSVFHSPAAQVYLSATLLLDRIRTE
jgi:hypothetical protein